MTKYRVIFDDPDALDEPTKVLVPSQNWLDEAMAGGLPPAIASSGCTGSYKMMNSKLLKKGVIARFGMIQTNMRYNGLRLALGL